MVHVVAFLLLTHVTTYLLYHQSFLVVAHVVGPTRTYDHQLWHSVWKVQRLPPILIPDDMCAVALIIVWRLLLLGTCQCICVGHLW